MIQNVKEKFKNANILHTSCVQIIVLQADDILAIFAEKY